MEFDVAFTNKKITPLSGMVFLSEFLNKIRFREQVDTCLSLPIQGSNRGHNVGDLLEAFTASVWCGGNRFMYTEVTFAAESNRLGPNNNGNKYDNYNVNFSLPISPKDFKIHKKPHHLTKTIFIRLALGRINLLAPGQEAISGDAYKKNDLGM